MRPICLIFVLTTAACSSAPAAQSSVAPSTFASVEPVASSGDEPLRQLTPMERFAVDFPQSVVIAFESVWTANENIDTVTRIDPTSGDIAAIKLDAGIGPQSIAVADGAIWVRGAGGIARIDPATNSVTGRIDNGGGRLLHAFGSLWAPGRGELARIDPQTNYVAEVIKAPPHAGRAPDQGCGVDSAAGSLWLECGESVFRVEPESGQVIARIDGVGPNAVVFGTGESVWLKTGLDPFRASSPELAAAVLDRIDPETNRVVDGTTVELVHGATVNSGVVDGTAIWLPTTFGEGPGVGELLVFDTQSGRVINVYDLSEGKGYGSNAIAFGYGSMWTASGGANQVRRFAMPPN